MKKPLLLAMLTIGTLSLSAQEVIATQGDSFSNSTGGMDWTIGEAIIETHSSATDHLTQGFHQPGLSVTAIEDHEKEMAVKIFPNPSTDQLTIQTDAYGQGKYYQLIDVNGKSIINEKLSKPKTLVNVSTLSSGTYMLILSDNKDQTLKTFKIQKK